VFEEREYELKEMELWLLWRCGFYRNEKRRRRRRYFSSKGYVDGRDEKSVDGETCRH
jgi:hypothetical protein